jgi:Beta-glucosidase-related glycosidases
MKKKKLTKIISYIITTVVTLGVLVPTVYADNTVYTIETREVYAVENGVQVPIKVDYVTNPNGGPVLGLLHPEGEPENTNSNLIIVNDGGYTYAFKDMNGNGVLDPYEDWRLSAEERAEDLANYLAFDDPDGIRKIAGLMLFSSHERNSAAGLSNHQKDYLTNSYLRNVLHASGNNVKDSVGWSNAMQAFVEASDFNVPIDFSSDPRSTAGTGDLYSDTVSGQEISLWPSNIGMAATFDVDHMYNFAKATSAEYRALGILTALGPQIDLATDPRWIRNGGTFGENTLLATDMAQAYVDGSQSSYDQNGQDIGWGSDSINAMIKHFPGDGPGEGGREAHTRSGLYGVYPGNNFQEHLIPFAEGGLKLNGLTKSATAVMTSYSISIQADGSALGGERVGSAYSSYKMNILRDDLGFDGVVCTDWGVTSRMAWGMEEATVAERHYEILMAGTDMFGGNNSNVPIIEAFDMMVNNPEIGEVAARERFAQSARRLLLLTMRPGLFENPYLDLDNSLATAGSADKVADGYLAQLESVVMLKNKNNVIAPMNTKDKQPSEMTVYIPYTYTSNNQTDHMDVENNAAGWTSTMNLDVASQIYGKVITDVRQPDGSYKVPDLSEVDLVIAGMRSPNNGGMFDAAGMKIVDGVETFYPLSLQYRPYTADGDNVRRVSIAGDINPDGTQQNRSYFGATSEIANEYDLTATLNAIEAVKLTGKDIPIVVALNANLPTIVNEFESLVDAIVVGFSVSDQALFDIINGKHEPRGLLPMQFPANMDTVEANEEDVAGDLECHLDTEGNTYDVAYGLNWSGIIDDDRVEAYNPDRPNTIDPSTPIVTTPAEPELPENPGSIVTTPPNGAATTPINTGDFTSIDGLVLGIIASAALVATYLGSNKKRKVKE